MTSGSEPDHEKPNSAGRGGKSDSDHGATAAATETTAEGDGAKPKKPSQLKAWWSGLGLDVITVLTMAKGGLPPAIGLALLVVE